MSGQCWTTFRGVLRLGCSGRMASLPELATSDNLIWNPSRIQKYSVSKVANNCPVPSSHTILSSFHIMFRFRSSIMIRDRFQARVTGNPSVACTLWLFNIAMEAMAHRNRWFTWVYLLKLVIFHGYVQYIYIQIYIYILVGGCSHLEKYESQMGVLFPIYGTITHVPNHQPDGNIINFPVVEDVFRPCLWLPDDERDTVPDFQIHGYLAGSNHPEYLFWCSALVAGSDLNCVRWLSISKITRPGKPTFT